MTDEKKGEEAGGAAAAPEAPSTEVAATDGGEKQKRMQNLNWKSMLMMWYARMAQP